MKKKHFIGGLQNQLFSHHIKVAKCVGHKITHIEITIDITLIITRIITSHINSRIKICILDLSQKETPTRASKQQLT